MTPVHGREEREIQPADPGARARAVWLVTGVMAVVGVSGVASVIFEGRFTPWAQGVAYELVLRPELLFAALLAVTLPLVGVAVYVFLQGSRIVKAERLPYPGQKVIRPTPVIKGKKAVQRGRAVQVIAVIMALFSLAMPFVPPLMLMLMGKGI